MQNIWWVGLELMMCIIELIVFHMFMSKYCEKRKIDSIGKVFIFLGLSILLYIKAYWEISDLIKIVLSTLMFVVYGVAFFKTKIHSYFIYVGLYILLVALSDNICTAIICTIYPSITISDLMEEQGLRYLVGMISKVFSLCLVLVLFNKEKNEPKSYSRDNLKVLFFVFLISIICLYNLLVIKQSHSNSESGKQIDVVICLISLSMFFVDMTIYWAIKQLNIKLNQEKEYELIQYQNELLTKAVLEHKEVEKEWRKNRHDFNNHISCIDMLLQMENIPKARTYIQDLTNNWQKNDLNIHIGNEIADAVVNQKAVHAKNLKIDFSVIGQIDERIHIGDMDLCALLSNSLDNAIEAAKQVPDIKDRKIEIVFSNQDESMIIKVRNSVKENITVKDELITTKKDRRRHGIGMMSMQTTTNKYGGILEWYCEDYQFHLNIKLPI